MNFLAHLYLSGDNPGVMLGNFIGDFVKGRDLADRFDREIALGVEMHRGIDEFTDHHPVVKLSKARLRPSYRHYAGVITDIFFDHFLAAGWKSYSVISLEEYAARAYAMIESKKNILPDRVRQMMPYMIRGNWLVSYAGLDGIQRAFSGMARRTSFESGMEKAVGDLKRYYPEFQDEFNRFFPDLQQWSANWLKEKFPGGQDLA